MSDAISSEIGFVGIILGELPRAFPSLMHLACEITFFVSPTSTISDLAVPSKWTELYHGIGACIERYATNQAPSLVLRFFGEPLGIQHNMRAALAERGLVPQEVYFDLLQALF